jgi:hypothetical protein
LQAHATIAFSAAVGEWLAVPKGTVRDTLREEWRTAILGDLSGTHDEYWLVEILKSDAELARRWLEIHLAAPTHRFIARDSVIAAAAAVLNSEERRALLARLHHTHGNAWLVSLLVGDDLEVYQWLLAEPGWRGEHLAPLAEPADGSRFEEVAELSDSWIAKARIALDAGYSVREIAYTKLTSPKFWVGNESTMWQRWADRFLALEQHVDLRIRAVGRVGAEAVAAERDRARKREKDEQTFGH